LQNRLQNFPQKSANHQGGQENSVCGTQLD